MPVPNPVLELLQRFERNIDAYRSGQYNETQVRLEFVDPFFKALGWDIHNEKGYAEAYKDVIHEESVKIGGVTKAPDYSFRIGGVRKFFVETKKPSVNLKVDASPAYQLRRYAWSAKLPLSVLTDFEEFVIYDCRVKPAKTDSASTARVKYLTYKEYETRWDEIVDILSRDAVLKGSFDKFAESTKGKKGTALVDDTILDEIDSWRDMLARNIALRNPKLSQRELNYAVQVTIDRIIFLRICEDRGIEEYGRLMALQNGTNMYKRLVEIFYRADERYNSGLFHFQSERDRPTPIDELTPGLAIDDNVLANILKRLYYPESPYEFSVLPADILGQVYEQFLGKVIRLTEGHRAVVEEKPEVKKAGGVYYTPTYIVDYIVKNTVGELLTKKSDISRDGAQINVGLLQEENTVGRLLNSDSAHSPGMSPPSQGGDKEGVGKRTTMTPKQVSKLRILDPACGSGSFLLGAYQYLLDWHLQWYVADGPEKHTKELYRGPGDDWRLTTAERKRILLNNIYGVDIDPQAVEVTKLSLLLKVLEGENDQTLSRQLKLIHERALPDLGSNIKCGNSLIGPDFYEGTQLNLLDEEERMRINVFDWEKEFPEIFKAEGPVHRSSSQANVGGFDAVIGNPPYGALFDDDQKKYIRDHFKSYQYKYDSYIYFIEKAVLLTRKGGLISFITPELWLRLENAESVRKFIIDTVGFRSLRVCGENVFRDAVVNTIIFVFEKGKSRIDVSIEMNEATWYFPFESWRKAKGLSIDYRIRPEVNGILSKLNQKITPLSQFGETIQGITAYDRYTGQSSDVIKSRAYHSQKKENRTFGRWLAGMDVRRYYLSWSGEWLSYGPWLAAPREPRFFEGPRILFREVPGKGKRIQAMIAKDVFYHGHSITPFKPSKENESSILYILGLANSILLSWFAGLMLPNFGKDVFPKLNPQDIKELPIRTINFSDPADKSRHDRMVALVEQMLELQKQLATAKTDHEKTALQRQIDATDKQIDQLVYELYGITEEEQKIIEGNNV